jgi:hypothetical protein
VFVIVTTKRRSVLPLFQHPLGVASHRIVFDRPRVCVGSTRRTPGRQATWSGLASADPPDAATASPASTVASERRINGR